MLTTLNLVTQLLGWTEANRAYAEPPHSVRVQEQLIALGQGTPSQELDKEEFLASKHNKFFLHPSRIVFFCGNIHENMIILVIKTKENTMTNQATKTKNATTTFIKLQATDYMQNKMCSNILFTMMRDLHQQQTSVTMPFYSANFSGLIEYADKQIVKRDVAEAQFLREKERVETTGCTLEAATSGDVKGTLEEGDTWTEETLDRHGEIELVTEQQVDTTRLNETFAIYKNAVERCNNACNNRDTNLAICETVMDLYKSTHKDGKEYLHPTLAKEEARLAALKTESNAQASQAMDLEATIAAYKALQSA